MKTHSKNLIQIISINCFVEKKTVVCYSAKSVGDMKGHRYQTNIYV